MVGGGPAGTGPALDAAKEGAQTLLIENRGFSGGIDVTVMERGSDAEVEREIKDKFAVAKAQSPFEPVRLLDHPMYPGWREFVTTSETLARMCREEAGCANA